MRTAVLNVARVALLAGPTVLAFFTGGYFETQQAVAGLIAWLLVVVALLASSRPLPARKGCVACHRGPRRPGRVDAAVDQLGSGRGQRLPVRADRDAVHRRAAGGGDAPPGPRRSENRRTGAGRRRADRDRLRNLRPAISRRAPLLALDHGRGEARATAHVLERDGRARGARVRAVRAALWRQHAAARACASSAPPPQRRSASACISASRAGRCLPAPQGWSRSSSSRGAASSYTGLGWRSPPARWPRSPLPRSRV